MILRVAAVAVVSSVLAIGHGLAPDGSAAAASNWGVTVGSSGGEAGSGGLPAAPTGVSATCSGPVLSPTAVVTWSAVSQATSYSVYDSTTSATSGFNLVAGAVGTTTWTSPSLTTGSYWYRVAAAIGGNWLGAQSSTSQQVIVVLGLSCTG